MASNRSIACIGMLLGACGGDDRGLAEGGSDGESGVVTVSDSASSEGTDSASVTSGSAADGSEGVTKFDLAGQPDASSGCGGAPDFSYIWIANSPEGTISKIGTETLVEEGRYIVRSDAAGNPSRTSVNLNGDVAVANRLSGITKIYARPEECDGPTSTGAEDVKPWMDGCIAWFTPFEYASQRPVAWTQGEFDSDTCRYENTKLWTSGANDSMDVILMDGETGVVEQSVTIPDVPANFYGIYGGAVDSEGNFWGAQAFTPQAGLGVLVRVDIDDFSVKTWQTIVPSYGVTVDGKGRPWTCYDGIARFDPTTETWMTNATAGGFGSGCMVDGDGILWQGAGVQPDNSRLLLGFDTETLQVVKSIPIPDYAKGISIDFQGNVWAVSTWSDAAYRVNPTTMQVDTVGGLVDPYTYSDMTGFALSQAGGAAG